MSFVGSYDTGNAQGALIGSEPINREKMVRDQRMQSAVWALNEARRIRNDPALMTEIRAWVAEKRSEFMELTDHLGN